MLSYFKYYIIKTQQARKSIVLKLCGYAAAFRPAWCWGVVSQVGGVGGVGGCRNITGCVLGTKLLKNTNRKPYTIYRMELLSTTMSDLWPRFQGHDIFRHWIWISQKRHGIEP